MTCPNCGAQTNSPFCPHCGAAQKTVPAEPATPRQQTVYVHTANDWDSAHLARCPKCHSTSIHSTKRGYSFFWGLIGFFLIPVVGLLLGCIGSKRIRCHCMNCGKRWKP